MPKHKFSKLQFQVEAPLGHGYSIVVTGTGATLGDNDPNNGVPLFTSPEDYPKWSSEYVSLASNRDIKYRYAIFLAGKLVGFEKVEPYRVVRVKGEMQIVSDVLNNLSEGQGPSEDERGDRPGSDMDPKVVDGLKSFSLEEGNENNVVIVREQSDATAVASVPIDARPFTPHVGAKHSPMGLLMGETDKPKSASAAKAHRRRVVGSAPFIDPDQVSISGSDGVIVVSYFLPVTVSRIPLSQGGGWAVAWDQENILALRTRLRVTWVGTVRLPGNETLTPEDQEALGRALSQSDCVPVFIDAALHDKFYKVFCKGTLWPVFHHILDVYGPRPTRFWDQKTQEDVWQSYTFVNMKFRDKVVEVYNEGDLIWIHGFHLLVLPSFISKSLPTAKTALFLHTPFPSSEIFRSLSVREDLLRGMLNADHIGFHLFEYSRHFLTCVRRILGLTCEMESGQLAVHYNGRTVAISSIHVGIDTRALKEVMALPQVELDATALKERYRGRRIILGIDRLERIRGLPLKLLAYEQFLSKYPQWVGRVVLVQVGITASERADDFNRTRQEVVTLVTRINATYADLAEPPVVFLERDESKLRLSDRLSLLGIADVFLVSSPRDGLNRMPMEFVAAQSKTRPDNPGVLMLSEFVSCTRVLLGALYVNPWKVQEMVDTLDRSLNLSLDERMRRHTKDLDFINTHTVLQWAYQILLDLKRVRKDFDRSYYKGVGLGLGFRVLGMESGFNPLATEEVVKAYRNSSVRLIMTDYGGTLVADNEKAENVKYYAVLHKMAQRQGPPKKVVELLSELSSDLKNLVFVVTGREKSFLDDYFSSFPNLGLGAEHGFYFQWPQHTSTPHKSHHVEWETMLPSFDSGSWMDLARAIMDIYVMRTHGTYIEQKGSALLWQYRDADPEFGHMQSKELEDHLNGVLRGFGVEVLRGENNPMQGGYIEVRPEGVSKGTFLRRILDKLRDQGRPADFVLVIGDDPSDEDMFTAAEEYAANILDSTKVFSCTVGKKPSHARSFLNDVDEVHALLDCIVRAHRVKKNFRPFMSQVDLRHLHESPNSPKSLQGGTETPVRTGGEMKHSLSMGDINSARVAAPALGQCLSSPSSAMTWQRYQETIEEGNEEGIFF